MRRVTIGTDPELVVVDGHSPALRSLPVWNDELAGLPVPGFFALPVLSTEHPDITIPFGKLRPDGMAVEFTVDPTDDVNEMVARVRANIRATDALVHAHIGGTLGVEPRFVTHKRWIDALPERMGNACSLQILGCAPDFNALGLDVPERPDPKTYYYRTSGGHIHFGLDEMTIKDRVAYGYVVGALDALIGTGSTYLCDSEQARRRKELYGMASMIRINDKIHTLEYRTLPAQALVQTPELATMMFDLGQAVVSWIVERYHALGQSEAVKLFRTAIGTYNDLIAIANAVNAHDVDACRQWQLIVADRLSAHVTVNRVYEMQAYAMPKHFNLVGW